MDGWSGGKGWGGGGFDGLVSFPMPIRGNEIVSFFSNKIHRKSTV